MRVVALTAHGLCDLQQAEALVLEWFESEGLELVHGRDGVLIAMSEAGLSSSRPLPALAVDVRLYNLGGGWLQARWSLQLVPDADLERWAEALLVSLRRRLGREPQWRVDGP